MPTRMRPACRHCRRSVARNITVPASRQTGTSSVRSKLRSLTSSAEPTSAPRTARMPDRPVTMSMPAKEPTSSVTAVELCSAIASTSPVAAASRGLSIVRRSLRLSTLP